MLQLKKKVVILIAPLFKQKNIPPNHTMVKQKIGLMLDENLLTFLDEVAGGNRSEYLNKLLANHRKQVLEAKMIAALGEDIKNSDYLEEIKDWDSVVEDGIDAISSATQG